MVGKRHLIIAFSIASLLALLSCATLVPVASATDASFESIFDGQASKLTILTPTSGAYLNSSMVTISWSYNADDLSYFDMSVDDGEHVAVNDSFAVLELLDGRHVVEVRAHTTVNEVHVASVHFVVDTVAPTVSVSPTGTNISIDTPIVAMFSSDIDPSSARFVIDDAVHNATWSWFGYVATCDMTAPLTAGHEHHAAVYGRDRAGNAVSEQWSFRTVDGGTVVGRYLYENGSAVVNMTVMLDCGLTAITDDNGRFIFENVPVGPHDLSFVNDWQFTNESMFDKATPVVVTAGNTTDIGDIIIVDREVLSITFTTVAFVVVAATVFAFIAFFAFEWYEKILPPYN